MVKKNIVFVINDLDTGGAEAMLVKLITNMDKEKFNITVVCLKSEGQLSSQLNSIAIPVYYLRIKNWRNLFFAPVKLLLYFKKNKPDIVQSWMYHADFLAGVAAKCLRIPCIIWTVRNNKLAPGRSKLSTRLLVSVLAKLSYFIPNKVICCATDIKNTHEKFGYDSKKMCVIYNGFNTVVFQKNNTAYQNLRDQHPFFKGKLCVGLLGRYHPDKGIDVFLKAAQMTIRLDSNFVFILAGSGLDASNKALMAKINTLSLNDHVFLRGLIANTAEFLCGLDIFVSSSLSEGFSNAIGEAMSCEVPCIVTDVGDSAYLLSMPDYVIPAGDPSSLSRCLLDMKNQYNNPGLVHIGQALRNRIIEHFSIESIAKQYQQLYTQ